MNRHALLIPLFAACSDYGFNKPAPEWPDSVVRPLDNVQQIDRIVQVTTPMVDVLWTIDNSCSMGNEQDELAENFPKFISYFIGSGLDYHIGVTSTDIDRQKNGTDGSLRTAAGTNVIDTHTPSPEIVFAQMAQMGTMGSGAEKGLGATYKALELKRDTVNAGFFREEAAIHTVLISDEKDQTPDNLVSPAEFIGWYDNLKKDTSDRSFSCIVGMSGFDRGTDYINAAQNLNGIIWDITDEDYQEVLERLGIQAAGLKREYFLSQRPTPGSLLVSVEDSTTGAIRAFTQVELDAYGQPIADGGTDVGGEPVESDYYTYDSTRNSITFLTFIPQALSTVILEYTLLSAQQVQEAL